MNSLPNSQISAMSDFIPRELLADVLVRLPVISLFRCRRVSKSWRDLIDSPCFTQLYLKRSPPNSKVIVALQRGGAFYAFDWVHEWDGGSHYRASNPKKLENHLSDFLVGQVQIVGSSNGILCLWNITKDGHVLWNPWINKFSILPPLPVDCKNGGSYCVGAAFGSDHSNDDYKVVKWFKLASYMSWELDDASFDGYEDSSFDGYEFCVYSLKLNSWRRIKDAMPHEMPQAHDCTFVNGALYFLVQEKMKFGYHDNFIVAFDLGSEEFRRISTVPHSPRFKEVYEYHHLCSLNGRLACISTYTERLFGELWVMVDDGAKRSWTLFACINIGLSGSDCRVMAVSERSKKMLLQVGKKLALYDIENRSIRDVIINDKPSCITSCTCVRGFVSPCSSLG
ncbi:OLC1v1032266C1 [Oldenlandia corymbosa var. corymbosa]|uniref:OLC1v1032266C1 n=1 Tax=Oldenlandia corymbosa var. corymbosa TaxID=529605 RepID=A0AAV1CLE0_OLDCO|nr:OLC1v1032266C1 [Oldenlandia corymbosa var. corymbosa]